MSAKTAGKRNRSSLMHVYLHDREHNLIRDAAELEGLSVSAWIRQRAVSAAREIKRSIAARAVLPDAAE